MKGLHIHPRYWIYLNAMKKINFSIIVENDYDMYDIFAGKIKYKNLLSELVIPVHIISSIRNCGTQIYTTNESNAKGQISSNSNSFKGSLFNEISDTVELEQIFNIDQEGHNQYIKRLLP